MTTHTVQCPICLDEVHPMVTVPCGHPICPECVCQISTCAICRTTLQAPKAIRVYLDYEKLLTELEAARNRAYEAETALRCLTTANEGADENLRAEIEAANLIAQHTSPDKALEAAIRSGTRILPTLIQHASIGAASASLMQVVKLAHRDSVSIAYINALSIKALTSGFDEALEEAVRVGKTISIVKALSCKASILGCARAIIHAIERGDSDTAAYLATKAPHYDTAMTHAASLGSFAAVVALANKVSSRALNMGLTIAARRKDVRMQDFLRSKGASM